VAIALCTKGFPGNSGGGGGGGGVESSIHLFMYAYYETPVMVTSQSD
jgi:hypothetical protein